MGGNYTPPLLWWLFGGRLFRKHKESSGLFSQRAFEVESQARSRAAIPPSITELLLPYIFFWSGGPFQYPTLSARIILLPALVASMVNKDKIPELEKDAARLLDSES